MSTVRPSIFYTQEVTTLTPIPVHGETGCFCELTGIAPGGSGGGGTYNKYHGGGGGSGAALIGFRFPLHWDAKYWTLTLGGTKYNGEEVETAGVDGTVGGNLLFTLYDSKKVILRVITLYGGGGGERGVVTDARQGSGGGFGAAGGFDLTQTLLPHMTATELRGPVGARDNDCDVWQNMWGGAVGGKGRFGGTAGRAQFLRGGKSPGGSLGGGGGGGGSFWGLGGFGGALNESARPLNFNAYGCGGGGGGGGSIASVGKDIGNETYGAAGGKFCMYIRWGLYSDHFDSYLLTQV